MARILLVDDDEISLMMTEMVLSEMHYDVTTAANGREAIALLQREPYDLLMLDIVMEDMSGIETLARIRKIEKISGIRISSKNRRFRKSCTPLYGRRCS